MRSRKDILKRYKKGIRLFNKKKGRIFDRYRSKSRISKELIGIGTKHIKYINKQWRVRFLNRQILRGFYHQQNFAIEEKSKLKVFAYNWPRERLDRTNMGQSLTGKLIIEQREKSIAALMWRLGYARSIGQANDMCKSGQITQGFDRLSVSSNKEVEQGMILNIKINEEIINKIGRLTRINKSVVPQYKEAPKLKKNHIRVRVSKRWRRVKMNHTRPQNKTKAKYKIILSNKGKKLKLRFKPKLTKLKQNHNKNQNQNQYRNKRKIIKKIILNLSKNKRRKEYRTQTIRILKLKRKIKIIKRKRAKRQAKEGIPQLGKVNKLSQLLKLQSNQDKKLQLFRDIVMPYKSPSFVIDKTTRHPLIQRVKTEVVNLKRKLQLKVRLPINKINIKANNNLNKYIGIRRKNIRENKQSLWVINTIIYRENAIEAQVIIRGKPQQNVAKLPIILDRNLT